MDIAAEVNEEDLKEDDHVTISANQITECESVDEIPTPSVASLLTQPEGTYIV